MTDFRTQIRRSHYRRIYLWGIFILTVLLLLSVASAGFFLYSALVVMGLLVLSSALASTSLIGMHITRRLSYTEIRLGEAVDARLTVHNRKGLPASWIFWQDHIDKNLDVEGSACHFKSLWPKQTQRLEYRLHSTRRGFFHVGPAVMEAGGPFGLVRRFLLGQTVDFITVLPQSIPIGRGLPQGQQPVHQVPRRRSIFEDPSRFMGMRDYRPGDSLRRIHWRATARSGKIQVKLFEPAVLAGALLAVDMGLESYPLTRQKPQAIDPLLELTVTAAASLGEYILSGDQKVGLISNGSDAADRYPEDWSGGSFRRLDEALEKTDLRSELTTYQPIEMTPAKGHWQQERLLTALARLMPHGSVTLPELLMTELPRLPRSLVLMVITPALNRELNSVLGSLKRSGIETAVVWTQSPEQNSFAGAVIPRNIPVYRVRDSVDIEQLGGRSL